MKLHKFISAIAVFGIAATTPSSAFVQDTSPDSRTAQQLEEEAAALIARAAEIREQARQARITEAFNLIAEEDEALRRGAQARTDLVSLGRDAPPPPLAAQTNDVESKDDSDNPLNGFGFGAGIAYILDTGRHDRIAEADLVGDDKIVRIRRLENSSARFIFETHYFFTPCGEFLSMARLGLRNECSDEMLEDGSSRYQRTGEANWGIGPFIAVQPDSNNVIDAIGGGIMVGLRRSGGQSFNFGAGYLVDINAQILGEGIVADQPLPAGEAGIRFQDRAQGGLMLITSYAF